jgi:hypothetical protein
VTSERPRYGDSGRPVLDPLTAPDPLGRARVAVAVYDRLRQAPLAERVLGELHAAECVGPVLRLISADGRLVYELAVLSARPASVRERRRLLPGQPREPLGPERAARG